MDELDLRLADGRTLHAYDVGPDAAGSAELVVVWHHGTPNIGLPPEPLVPASRALGIRWVSYDRPGYGGSTPRHGRDVASAAADVAAVVDALGIDRFAVMGHSGGGPHALACAALLPERVVAAVGGAGLAPFSADGLAWFDGMAETTSAALRAAAMGRAAKERYEASAPEADPGFVAADHEALRAEWSWFGKVVEPALAAGPGGLIDDDLAYVSEWGFDPARIGVPVLLLHGTADRVVPPSHARWLAGRCPSAELRLVPDAGHISVLGAAVSALEWLRQQADSEEERPRRWAS